MLLTFFFAFFVQGTLVSLGSCRAAVVTKIASNWKPDEHPPGLLPPRRRKQSLNLFQLLPRFTRVVFIMSCLTACRIYRHHHCPLKVPGRRLRVPVVYPTAGSGVCHDGLPVFLAGASCPGGGGGGGRV